MKRLPLFVIGLAAASAAVAQNSYVCVAERATGFALDKKTNQWSVTAFKAGTRYVFSRSTYPQYKWEVRVDGGKDPVSWCAEDFNGAGNLICRGLQNMNLSRKSMRFISTYVMGYWNDVLDDPSPANPAREGMHAPRMEIGKCRPG